jgi:hypothetical protein
VYYSQHSKRPQNEFQLRSSKIEATSDTGGSIVITLGDGRQLSLRVNGAPGLREAMVSSLQNAAAQDVGDEYDPEADALHDKPEPAASSVHTHVESRDQKGQAVAAEPDRARAAKRHKPGDDPAVIARRDATGDEFRPHHAESYRGRAERAQGPQDVQEWSQAGQKRGLEHVAPGAAHSRARGESRDGEGEGGSQEASRRLCGVGMVLAPKDPGGHSFRSSVLLPSLPPWQLPSLSNVFAVLRSPSPHPLLPSAPAHALDLACLFSGSRLPVLTYPPPPVGWQGGKGTAL